MKVTAQSKRKNCRMIVNLDGAEVKTSVAALCYTNTCAPHGRKGFPEFPQNILLKTLQV